MKLRLLMAFRGHWKTGREREKTSLQEKVGYPGVVSLGLSDILCQKSGRRCLSMAGYQKLKKGYSHSMVDSHAWVLGKHFIRWGKRKVHFQICSAWTGKWLLPALQGQYRAGNLLSNATERGSRNPKSWVDWWISTHCSVKNGSWIWYIHLKPKEKFR